MTIEKALDEVAKEYAKALRLDYVWNPLAWALYRVWRKADADPGRLATYQPPRNHGADFVRPCGAIHARNAAGIPGMVPDRRRPAIPERRREI